MGPTQANAKQAAAFRDRILTLLQFQTDWIRSLDLRAVNRDDLPRHEMVTLGQLAGMLNASLEILETDDTDDPAAISGMLESLDQAASTMHALIAQVEAVI